MDEYRHNIGVNQVPHTVRVSSCNVKYRKQGGRQEWVSVVECICADGSVTNPLLILKGEKISTNWLPETIPTQQWWYAASHKGWTNDHIALDWLKRSFEPQTREKAAGAPRVLIFDGHGSHTTTALITYAMQNNIILLQSPPHISHLLQLLDVGLFGPVKTFLSQELKRLTIV